jgi:hypothetical protein
MKPFDRTAEATQELAAFTKKLWDALVPSSGACVSVQGELVRVNERLWAEAMQEGMGNYYESDDGRARYGAMIVFLLDTLVANRAGALEGEDVDYFARVRGALDTDWRARSRMIALENGEGELSAAEAAELEQLAAAPELVPWQEMLTRAERCVANHCMIAAELVDRDGKPVTERGVRNVLHVFEPAPAPAAPCPKCNGKGWLAPSSPSDFPAMCSCKQA